MAGEAFFVTKAKGPGAGVSDVAVQFQGLMKWRCPPPPATPLMCLKNPLEGNLEGSLRSSQKRKPIQQIY